MHNLTCCDFQDQESGARRCPGSFHLTYVSASIDPYGSLPQITAEQLLREVSLIFILLQHTLNFFQAQERQESTFRAPKQRVEDFEELHEYRGRKRKEFEERVRRTRGSMWVSFSTLVTRLLNILTAKNGPNMQTGRYVL